MPFNRPGPKRVKSRILKAAKAVSKALGETVMTAKHTKKKREYPPMPKDAKTLEKMMFDVADYKAFRPGKRKQRAK